MSQPQRRPSGAKTESLTSVAQRLYDDAGQDTNKGADLLVDHLFKYPTYHREAFTIAAAKLMSNFRHADNGRLRKGQPVPSQPMSDYTPANDGPAPSARSPAAHKASSARIGRVFERLEGLFLLKFKYNGVEYVLGRSTPAELRPVAAHYVGQGSTMLREGRWLEKVIASSKEGLPIARSLSLADVKKFKAEADKLAV